MTRLEQEEAVRDLLEKEFGVSLTKRRLPVGTKSNGETKYHEFDCVSADANFIAEVKTNQLKATPEKPNGRYFSAIKWALLGDIYMLSRLKASRKLLVLTDRPLFELSSKDMDGILPENTELVCREIPANNKMERYG